MKRGRESHDHALDAPDEELDVDPLPDLEEVDWEEDGPSARGRKPRTRLREHDLEERVDDRKKREREKKRKQERDEWE